MCFASAASLSAQQVQGDAPDVILSARATQSSSTAASAAATRPPSESAMAGATAPGALHGAPVSSAPGAAGPTQLPAVAAGSAPGGGLLITGSADRSIVIWDVWASDPANHCVQRLFGHNGTITALASVAAGVTSADSGALLSCSVDGTLRVWIPSKGRRLMLYPWLVLSQQIGPLDCWLNALCVRHSDTTMLHVADSSGCIRSFAALDAGCTQFKETAAPVPVHALGVTRVFSVPGQNFVVSMAYDNTFRVVDAARGIQLLQHENQGKCRFTAAAWDPAHQELYVSDQRGRLLVWSVYAKKCVKEHQLSKEPILDLHFDASLQQLYATVPSGVLLFSIERDLGYVEHAAHSDAVVAVGWMHGDAPLAHHGSSRPPSAVARLRAPQSSQPAPDAGDASTMPHDKVRIVTASLDNTMRCWDPYDMSQLYSLSETVSEVSSMIYLHEAQLIVTGNDDGSIRWWNSDTGSVVTMHRHANTVSAMCLAYRGRVSFLLSAGYDGCAQPRFCFRPLQSLSRPRRRYAAQLHCGM
jgi:WD40 repeat protein